VVLLNGGHCPAVFFCQRKNIAVTALAGVISVVDNSPDKPVWKKSMIEDPPLLTLKRKIRRPAKDKVDTLAKASTGVLVDCLGGRGAFCQSVKPINPDAIHFAGVALTCDAGPADNLAVFGAIHLAEAGDVIVIATDAFMATAVIGDMVVGMARNNGVNAVVTDGCIRDIEGTIKTGLPCYAAGVTPNSPARNGPGTAGFPITVGGVQVNSGDVIVGDRDGVVVVPFERIDEAIARLDEVLVAEAALDASVSQGLKMPEFASSILEGDRITWVD